MAAFAMLPLSSCQPEQSSLVSDVAVSVGEKQVTFRGATVTVSFSTPYAWTARLDLKNGEGEWASIRSNTLSGEAKNGALVRIVFEENKSADERVCELWLDLEGRGEECVCTLTQAASSSAADAAISQYLNTYMHEILKKDYLFDDAYNALDVDLTVSYQDFLSTHLLALGEVNVADGGYNKETGDRYIYTNIAEVQIGTKAIETGGFGFGPFISTALSDGSTDMGIAPAYVRRGSPAAAAGLRRGDLIFGVNGQKLTTNNYRTYMTTLYQGTSGSYTFDFMRLEDNDGMYGWNQYKSSAVAAAAHVYDPVLHQSILTDPLNPATKIGYLVYESFDLNSHEFLQDAVSQFVSAGITDMILDLRFNAGGAVAQSRWLSGCIAGAAHDNDIFTKVIYNNGAEEKWTFGHGYTSEVDNLGKPTYLGLSRLYVITSYNTASAAELVITSLKGVDFPVKLIGGETEGKNVGMTVTEVDYETRRFQFAPVTFWVRNAKDFGDYANGILPDEFVPANYDNAFPYSFADWGNIDKNIALQWAYCDITGKDRWSSTITRSVSAVQTPTPGYMQPLDVQHGRFGNLVYEK